MSKERNIEVPLEDWARRIAAEAGREAALAVLDDHVRKCPVNDMKLDMYGNGKPGLKADVSELKRAMRRRWWQGLLDRALTVLVAGAVWWIGQAILNAAAAEVQNRTPTPASQPAARH